MSEQILERAATTGAHGGPPIAVPESAAPRRNRTFLVVALAIVAGLVVGGLALFLLQPGASDAPAEGPLAAGPAAAAGGAAGAAAGSAESGAAAEGEAGAAAEGSAATAEAPAEPTKRRTSTRLTSRDPFAPLVVRAEPPPAPKPAKQAKPSGTTADQAAPAAAAPDAAAPGAAPAAPSAAPATAPTPATGGTISSLQISPLGTSVTLKLDGERYEVDEGEAFAKSYRLYDIFNANCAGFLYGDQNAVVCQGDTVTIG